MTLDNWAYESSLYAQGCQCVAGVDEAGRGPLAGPVVVAAVILPDPPGAPGVTDSKQLTQRQRERCYRWILKHALGVHVTHASHEMIDHLNILQATLVAMREAILGLHPSPDYVLVDGPHIPDTDVPCLPLVKGDELSLSVAAASIVAKVSRDNLMRAYHQMYPQYGFDQHKGYPTKAHYAALEQWGPSPIHRRSFRLSKSQES